MFCLMRQNRYNLFRCELFGIFRSVNRSRSWYLKIFGVRARVLKPEAEGESESEKCDSVHFCWFSEMLWWGQCFSSCYVQMYPMFREAVAGVWRRSSAQFVLCVNVIRTYVLKKSYFIFSITKDLVYARMKPARLSTSKKVNLVLQTATLPKLGCEAFKVCISDIRKVFWKQSLS